MCVPTNTLHILNRKKLSAALSQYLYRFANKQNETIRILIKNVHDKIFHTINWIARKKRRTPSSRAYKWKEKNMCRWWNPAMSKSYFVPLWSAIFLNFAYPAHELKVRLLFSPVQLYSDWIQCGNLRKLAVETTFLSHPKY